jgi:hypothetical protein
MAIPTFYDEIKAILIRMGGAKDSSGQFLEYGGVNKALSAELALLSVQIMYLGEELGLDWCKMFVEYFEKQYEVIDGKTREDTLRAIELIYSLKGGGNSQLEALMKSAVGQK